MPPVIQVTELHVTPNNCPLGDPLTLDLTFCSNEPLTGMHWEILLKDAADELIMQVSMVTQVQKQGDTFIREMLSPLL